MLSFCERHLVEHAKGCDHINKLGQASIKQFTGLDAELAKEALMNRTIRPNGDESELWLSLRDKGVILIVQRPGLLVEFQVSESAFSELIRRWTTHDYDRILGPIGGDGLSICIDSEGVTLLSPSGGLVAEILVPQEEFKELMLRWSSQDFDNEND